MPFVVRKCKTPCALCEGCSLRPRLTVLCATQVQQHEMDTDEMRRRFAPLLPCADRSNDIYHVFVSYRHGDDSEHASAFVNALCCQPLGKAGTYPNVYYDCKVSQSSRQLPGPLYHTPTPTTAFLPPPPSLPFAAVLAEYVLRMFFLLGCGYGLTLRILHAKLCCER